MPPKKAWGAPAAPSTNGKAQRPGDWRGAKPPSFRHRTRHGDEFVRGRQDSDAAVWLPCRLPHVPAFHHATVYVCAIIAVLANYSVHGRVRGWGWT